MTLRFGLECHQLSHRSTKFLLWPSPGTDPVGPAQLSLNHGTGGKREYSKSQVLKGEGCVVSRLYSLPFRQAVHGLAASPVLRLPLIEMNSFMNCSLSSVFSGLLAFRFCNWVLLVNFPYTYGLPPKIDFKVFENSY